VVVVVVTMMVMINTRFPVYAPVNVISKQMLVFSFFRRCSDKFENLSCNEDIQQP
jgi:hypothetical protein